MQHIKGNVVWLVPMLILNLPQKPTKTFLSATFSSATSDPSQEAIKQKLQSLGYM